MSDSVIQGQGKRLLHLDLLRLMAIVLVIFNHTGDRGYMLFLNQTESPLYGLYMMLSVFCKIAVPLFFMISGALLLPKEESLKQLFSKRILRMALVLLLISVPYYLWLQRMNGLSVEGFFTHIYSQSASTSLWYLYSYIALLFMLPFLRSMVKNLKREDFLFLFVGHLVLTGVLPCMEFALWKGSVTIHESFAPVLLVTQNVFYALMGYFCEHVADIEKRNAKAMWLGIGASAAAIGLTCLMTNWKIMVIRGGAEEAEQFFHCFLSIPTLTVYCLAKRVAGRIKNQGLQKWLPIIGSAVFGVYLIEKFVRSLTSIVYTVLAPVAGSMIASLLWCITVLCVSLLIVLFFKHIPVFKNLVNRLI